MQITLFFYSNIFQFFAVVYIFFISFLLFFVTREIRAKNDSHVFRILDYSEIGIFHFAWRLVIAFVRTSMCD